MFLSAAVYFFSTAWLRFPLLRQRIHLYTAESSDFPSACLAVFSSQADGGIPLGQFSVFPSACWAAFYSQADGGITFCFILGLSVGLLESFLFPGRRPHSFLLYSWSFRRLVGQLSILRPTAAFLFGQFSVFPSACWAAFYSQADAAYLWASSWYFRRPVGQPSILRPTAAFLFGLFSVFPSACWRAFYSQVDGGIPFGVSSRYFRRLVGQLSILRPTAAYYCFL